MTSAAPEVLLDSDAEPLEELGNVGELGEFDELSEFIESITFFDTSSSILNVGALFYKFRFKLVLSVRNKN
jgi:hypothetical protein